MAATFRRNSKKVLVEFRAGKMIMEGTTVKPDRRKGLIRIAREEDGLTHFQWEDRMRSFVEDDFIIFPDEAVFERVRQSQERVYILKFKHDQRKFFCWLQEPKADKDAVLCNNVNLFIDSLEVDQSSHLDMQIPTEAATPPVLSGTSEIATGRGTSSSLEMSPSTGTGIPVDAKEPVQLADLQRILSSIVGGASQSEPAVTLPRDTGPSLTEVLKPEIVVPLLENCHLEKRLAPYLPEGSCTHAAILELMKSPQFHQQVEAFTNALRSGQIDLSQFGIDSSKCDFTVSSFLEAFEDQIASKSDTIHSFEEQRTDSEGDKVSDESVQSGKDKDSMEEGR